MVQLWWNGVKVWDNNGQPLTGFSSPNIPGDPADLGITNSQASWGADTLTQPLPAQGGSGAEQKIFWHNSVIILIVIVILLITILVIITLLVLIPMISIIIPLIKKYQVVNLVIFITIKLI
jgi:hypothetical protein